MRLRLLILILFCFPGLRVVAQDTAFFANSKEHLSVGRIATYLEDAGNSLSTDDAIASHKFQRVTQNVQNYQVGNSTFWIKLIVKNVSGESNLVLELGYPTIDSITFISVDKSGLRKIAMTGEYVPYYQRPYRHQNYIFDLELQPGESKIYYLKLRASEQISLPLTISTPKECEESIFNRDLIFGLYSGIILVMLLYNLFLFFSVRDRSYIMYVLYILFVGLTQACLQGYAPRFLYPDSYFLANAMMVWVPALSGIFSVLFINDFMNIKSYTPLLYRSAPGKAGVCRTLCS